MTAGHQYITALLSSCTYSITHIRIKGESGRCVNVSLQSADPTEVADAKTPSFSQKLGVFWLRWV